MIRKCAARGNLAVIKCAARPTKITWPILARLMMVLVISKILVAAGIEMPKIPSICSSIDKVCSSEKNRLIRFGKW